MGLHDGSHAIPPLPMDVSEGPLSALLPILDFHISEKPMGFFVKKKGIISGTVIRRAWTIPAKFPGDAFRTPHADPNTRS